ncbi:MAG: DUF1573 domain-containing protein [Saprospiraceae bacterium]|nr:DUF1573 domain-containing protein [Saprospiraceae bacterium]
MYINLKYIFILGFIMTCLLNTYAQDKVKPLSKKELTERLLAVEKENEQLRNTIKEQKKDMDILRKQVQNLVNNLPKPGGRTSPGANTSGLPNKHPNHAHSGGGKPINDDAITSMKFAEMQYNFGDLKEGDKVSHIFKFTNTGKHPLKITGARGSCGCTVPEWPKEEIPVGGTGEIKVTFNSKGKKGIQRKQIKITANTDPLETMLMITAKVKS